MKHLKASFVTAGIAALLITANAAGAVYAFSTNDHVPSYKSVTPPAPSAPPAVYGAVSEESAVAVAKEMIESTYGVSINDFYSTVTVQTSFEETPAWYVSFIGRYVNVQEKELTKCYSVYVDSETAKILDSTNNTVVVSPSTKIYLAGDEDEVSVEISGDITEYVTAEDTQQ